MKMKYLVFFLILVVLASAKVDPKSERFRTMCEYFNNADCSSSHFSRVMCATNGKTYENMCYFHRDLCEDGLENMKIKHFGKC